jgi:predicted RecB family nuclease
MANRITNEVVEAHLLCAYKGHLKMAGERGVPSEYELMISECRKRIFTAAVSKLRLRHGGPAPPQGSKLDRALLERRSPLLVDILLETEDLSLRFDALLRVEGESRIGAFHYIPVLVHGNEKVTPGLRLALAIYGLALGTVQGKTPTSGMIIHGRTGACKSVQFGGVHDRAKRLLRTLQEAHEHSPPTLILNGHCLVCEYRARCRTEAVANDDLSLLRGMGEKEVRKYSRRGIFTVTQLSFTFHPPRRARKPTERKLCHSHALQALAVREKRVHVLGTPELPRASTHLYLDIEGDPERGFCYLLGLVVRVGDAEERHSFWIDSPSEEPLLLAQFLDVAALHPDAIIYTYGSYESAFLKRAGKVNGREEEVRAILARTFNVLSVVYLHVYFALSGLRWQEAVENLGCTPGTTHPRPAIPRRRCSSMGDALHHVATQMQALRPPIPTEGIRAIGPVLSPSQELGDVRARGASGELQRNQ